jgi:hypothetical protein
MRLCVACILLVATGTAGALPTQAMSIPGGVTRSHDMIINVGGRRYARARDCTPTNGPYGFYGNLWCQPANDASYMRNLGTSWPMNTPPSFRQPRTRSTGTDW